MRAPVAIGGSRLAWHELPPDIRRRVETAAGSPVARASSRPGGFSPGLASVLALATGRTVFAKAVNAGRNSESPGMHRREAEVLAALPAGVPVPRLLWSYDDGEWVVLLIEAVSGRMPAQPWVRQELSAYLAVAALLVDRLTPSPFAASPIQQQFATTFTGWRTLAGQQPGVADRIDPWARRHLDRLADIESGWPEAAAGDSLLHGDLRADNVLLTDGGVVVVDWPAACIGAGWVDMVCSLPSVAMHGGGDPERLLAAYPPADGADPVAVTAVLAAITGFFVHGSMQPPPPALPRLRDFQRAQGEAGLAWLRRRVGEGR